MLIAEEDVVLPLEGDSVVLASKDVAGEDVAPEDDEEFEPFEGDAVLLRTDEMEPEDAVAVREDEEDKLLEVTEVEVEVLGRGGLLVLDVDLLTDGDDVVPEGDAVPLKDEEGGLPVVIESDMVLLVSGDVVLEDEAAPEEPENEVGSTRMLVVLAEEDMTLREVEFVDSVAEEETVDCGAEELVDDIVPLELMDAWCC